MASEERALVLKTGSQGQGQIPRVTITEPHSDAGKGKQEPPTVETREVGWLASGTR